MAGDTADQLIDFVFPQLGARGALVEIQSGIDTMLGSRPYAPAVRTLLGQALAATPLLASHARFDGRLNLQYQGERAVKLLVTQIDPQLNLRGMAKAPADASGDFHALMGQGVLALMLEPRIGTQNYRALVETLGESLAESLEIYFAQSEQLPTLLRLAMSETRLSGILLQRLPEGEIGSSDAHWEHLKILFATLGEAELGEIGAQRAMQRLFHGEDLRWGEPRAIALACHCSHAGISTMLLALGEAEISPVLAERGEVEVTCEFCGKVYRYDEVQVRELFAAALPTAPDQTTKLN